MSSEELNPEASNYWEEYQTKTNEVSRNLLEDLLKEQSSLTDDFPICALLIDEALDRFFSTGLEPGCECYADLLNHKPMKFTQKVLVPVKEYPELNLSDKVLGSSLERLQDKTQCQVIVKGRNSMLDKVKEEELRQSGDARFKHLNKEQFLEISTVATPIECFIRMTSALTEIRKHLIPDQNGEEGSREKLSELIKIEPEVISSQEIVKCEQLEDGPTMEDPPLQVLFKEPYTPPTVFDKPQTSRKKPLIFGLADKLIKLLDETVLNPNFQYSEEETMMVSNNIDILNSFIVSKVPTKSAATTDSTSSTSMENKLTTTASLSKMRSLTKNLVAIKKHATKRKISNSKNTESKNEIRTTKNKLVRNALQKKERYPGLFYIKDIKSDKIIKRQISNRTTLSRCLKRSDKDVIEPEEEVEYNPFPIDYLQQTPTELVFEYTPRDIIISLLDTMKNYPVLWEFHDKPFNEDFIEAIEDLCQVINVKWSLSIDSLKMRRSINRVLRFYRYLFPFENIEKFAEYFDKCAVFLPSTVIKIPHARCSHCFICYKEDIELRRHVVEEHKWPYKCQHCAESFEDNDEFEFHKRLPHYVEIFTCEQCNERFNHRSEYNQHLGKHQQKPIEEPRNYVCNECGKKFKTNGELRSHKYYHEEKKFKCHLCPKAYFKSPTLTLHLKKHRNQLDFICEVCGKGFLQQKYLNEHMDTHNGIQITCNICNLKLRRGNLYRHLRTVHVAVEGTIESTFRAKGHRHNKHTHAQRRSYNLKPIYERPKRSKRSEEKAPRQYDCKVCNIHFDRLKFLKDHNRQYHENINKASCKMCHSQLAQKTNLKRHYREKHKLNDYQAFAIVEKDEDIETVLAMTTEEINEH